LFSGNARIYIGFDKHAAAHAAKKANDAETKGNAHDEVDEIMLIEWL